MKKLINPFFRGKFLRKQLVKDNKVLCVDFTGTLQEKDITKDLIMDVVLKKYTYRAKINIKDFDAEWRSEKGLPPFNFADHAAILKTLNDHLNFDIPLWFLRKAGDKLENIALYDLPLIYQIMGCNFCYNKATSGCIQCFVDNKSNVPHKETGVFLAAENIVNTFAAARQSQEMRVIRTSGGEPTLVLDHILSLYNELSNKGFPVLHQFDTNLSTGRLIEFFENEKIYCKDILKKIAEYNPAVLVSLKGTTDKNLQENTQAQITLNDQIFSLKKFVEAGVDVYPYIYNPDAAHLREFMERLESIFENILLKTHVVITKIYGPTKERIYNLAREKEVCAEELLREYAKKWEINYYHSCEIMNDLLNERYNLNYKELERPGIKITLKK